MAKRGTTLGPKNPSRRSHKTKKRLEVKKVTLATKKNKSNRRRKAK